MKRVLAIGVSIATVLAAIAVFVYCCPFVLGASDIGWLLRTGQFILSQQRLPENALFTWTCDKPWCVYQWLFEVLAAGLFQMGGLWLTGICVYILVAILVLFLLPQGWLRLRIPAWMTFLMLGTALTPPWFFARPQISSYVLIFVFLSILERFRTGHSKERVVFLLPPLMMLWANLHSFWFLGILSVLSYGVTTVDTNRRKWLFGTLLACILAVLINPYGIGLIRYNLSFLTEPDFNNIGELRSPIIMGEPLLYMFLCNLAVSWLLMIRFRKRVPISGFILAAIGTFAALKFSRFCPVATLFIWPYLGLALARNETGDTSAFNNADHSSGYRWLMLSHFISVIALAAITWYVRIPSDRAAAEVFMNNDLEAIEYLRTHKLPEPYINDPATGSHLILFGLSPVFIDNRFDMYGKQFCTEWQNACDFKPGWQTIFSKYGPVGQAIFLNTNAIAQALFADPNWLLAYDDGVLVHYLTNTAEHRDTLKTWSLDAQHIASNTQLPAEIRTSTMDSRCKREREFGLVAMHADKLDKAEMYFTDYVAMKPASQDAHHWLIHTLALNGKKDRLIEELKLARPLFWTFEGESATPSMGPTKLPEDKQKRVDSWALDAAKQLLKKYYGDPNVPRPRRPPE